MTTRMKTPLTTSVLALLPALALVAGSHVQADGWTGHTSLMIGSKSIPEDDWAKNDEHGVIGVITDFRQTRWPVSIAIDLFGTGSERKTNGNSFDTYTAEMHLGVRKVFELGEGFQPYIGGGLALINALQKSEIDDAKREDEDNIAAGWVGIGTYYSLTDSITVGADLRYVGGSAELDNIYPQTGSRDIDLAGTMGGLSLGYQW